MKCHICGGETSVLQTRVSNNIRHRSDLNISDGFKSLLRRRGCDSCGHRFTTREIHDDTLRKILKRCNADHVLKAMITKALDEYNHLISPDFFREAQPKSDEGSS